MDATRGASPALLREVEEYSKKYHTHTSTQNLEELCRQREMNYESVRKFKFAKQDQLYNEKARWGRLMNHEQFLKKLKTILPAYLANTMNAGLRGLAVLVPTYHGPEWKYVCAIQNGYTTEYEILHYDTHGLPLNSKFRGWRTVLLRLITQGFITEEQADQVFGPPTSGPVSARYREELYNYRNRQ